MSPTTGFRRPMAAVAVALLIAPVVALAVVVPRMARDAAEEGARDRVEVAATAGAVYVDEHLRGLGEMAALTASSPLVRNALTPAIDQATAEAARSRLSELRQARPGIATVVLTDAEGMVVTVDPPIADYERRSFRYRDWFRGGAARGGAPYISEIFTAALPDEPSVTAASAAVVDGEGRTVGVVAAAYRTDTIQSFVAGFSADRGAQLTVVDQRGRVAARPPQLSPTLTRSESDVLFDVTGPHGADASSIEIDGTPMLASAALAESSEWSILAEVDRRAALADANRVGAAVAGISGLLTLGFLAGIALLIVLWRGRARDQAELRRAHAAALGASRLKSEFLANMSHEIRTPMNGVIGMTDLLLATELSARQRGYAEALRSSGEHLLGILNDLLDLSKIEAGRLAIEDIDYDLVSTIEDAVAIHAPTAHAKGLELAVTIDPGVPAQVCGDPLRVRQVINNLVGNAVKFTSEGEVLVDVRLIEEAGVDAVRVEVRDTGAGISEEAQARLFKSFVQAESSTTRLHGGTGLGLAISRQLVELMGGTIGVQSSPETGSCFFFTLPVRAVHPREPVTRRRGGLTGVRVLVVDDNATNRAIMEANLQAWGLRPSTATDGDDALVLLGDAAAAGDPFSIALLDYHMPGMNGLELARAIRADPALSGTRMALLTSSGFDGGPETVREAGLEASLTKPVRQADLHNQLLILAGRRDADVEDDPQAPAAREDGSGSPDPAPGSASAPARGLAPRPAPAPEEASEPSGPPRPRVLLAEDQEINQQVATAMLESLGYAVDIAGDGHQAAEMASAHSYAAVLMDLQMPVMDGLAAARAIRDAESGTGRRVPILAMTASAMKGDEERCLAAGMDAYLTKPVTLRKLSSGLERLLDHHGPRDGSVLQADILAELLEWAPDRETLGGLIDGYLSTAETRARQLAEAVAAGDHERTLQIAHSLKGSSATFAASEVESLCQQIEAAVKAGGGPTELQRLVDRLLVAVPATAAELRSVIARR